MKDITDLAVDAAEAIVASSRAAYLAGAKNEALIAIGHDAIAALAATAPNVASVDLRIARAIGWVRERLDRPCR